MAHRILDTHQRQRILRPVRMLLLGEQGERERENNIYNSATLYSLWHFSLCRSTSFAWKDETGIADEPNLRVNMYYTAPETKTAPSPSFVDSHLASSLRSGEALAREKYNDFISLQSVAWVRQGRVNVVVVGTRKHAGCSHLRIRLFVWLANLMHNGRSRLS